jgi:hypothetical protein
LELLKLGDEAHEEFARLQALLLFGRGWGGQPEAVRGFEHPLHQRGAVLVGVCPLLTPELPGPAEAEETLSAAPVLRYPRR